MSFLPLYNSSLLGVLLLSLFLWGVSILPVLFGLIILSLVFFWFDLMNCCLHYVSAFWLFILSEVMAFGSLLLCCFYFDSCYYVSLSSPLEIPFLGCFVLLGSSITVTGFHHLLYWNNSWILLLLTIVLGVSFVILQLMEMNEIFINIYDSSFHASSFCTVGLHFSHVIVGVLGLLIVFIIGVVNTGEHRCTLVTWYWHFVDYIWLFVYTFVYVC
uniref:Cytochrome c oxidase subunit 3 n=1 Tax=Anindobothrium anacolum TaxID=2034264 RepID=A0A5B9IJ79_9CEST|nr:cytochrome c oxidase subunit 3 [Anindobothrium anacolum]QEF29870.1 cytochrome c oxidase subunit 3 [Anindobothrium anacolum]